MRQKIRRTPSVINPDPIPLSALNHWAYCPRRCGLIHMEGEFTDNIHTARGNASIDKDFLGNCTAIRTGRLAYPEDVKAVCKAMGIPPAKVEALRPLEWLEKDMASGKLTSGVLTF